MSTVISLSPSLLKTSNWDHLPLDLNPMQLPKHVAVIMDGNGRWAQQRRLPRVMGHRQGVDTLKALVRCCQDWGVPNLTVYAFSTENWKRPAQEVDFLMQLFEQVIWQELELLHQEGVRLTFIGDRMTLPASLQATLDYGMHLTAGNQRIRLTVALNYGSRQELVRACQRLSAATQAGNLNPESITEEVLARCLDTADLPDPDLLIRTSGEMRLSNFLLWQLAYTEIYCTQTLWPDFDRSTFHQALLTYQARDRRFGQLSPNKAKGG
jgi:undecaprenyl diphosphate synthase